MTLKTQIRKYLPDPVLKIYRSAKDILNPPMDDQTIYKLYKEGRIKPRLGDVSEAIADHQIPWLDRKDIESRKLTEHQAFWRENGYLILPKFLPDNLIDRYSEVRGKGGLIGWLNPVPYMFVDEMRDLGLYPPLMEVLNSLIGEEMAISLALTAWVTTGRNWHQDDYLNPPDVNTYYISCWMALDDITEDSGPYQYVPGSHRWPLVRGMKVKRFLDPEVRDAHDWPKRSEEILDKIFLDEIQRRKSPIKSFVAKRGDILIWHARLAHRGSLATRKDALRKSLICHYTSCRHSNREIARHSNQKPYFIVPGYDDRKLI